MTATAITPRGATYPPRNGVSSALVHLRHVISARSNRCSRFLVFSESLRAAAARHQYVTRELLPRAGRKSQSASLALRGQQHRTSRQRLIHIHVRTATGGSWLVPSAKWRRVPDHVLTLIYALQFVRLGEKTLGTPRCPTAVAICHICFEHRLARAAAAKLLRVVHGFTVSLPFGAVPVPDCRCCFVSRRFARG